ncbi:hypothetical protein VNO78_11589 [Psophocarpus tetragonolobus]|uniref:Glycosyltransferase n=1 Tax=Psophocarpus tetragonolobus TaxID=3891 RepID=A0AAN9SMP7_PSOTE
MGSKHVAIFTFPFGTHVAPLLNLVLKLANAAPNCLFSFIGTEKCNAIHFPMPHIPSNVKPYSISDGIPEGHPLADHPIEKLNFFLQTGPDNLHTGIRMAEEDTKKKVTCIIADAFVTSSLTVAQTLNLPWISFWPPTSCSASLYFYVDLIRAAKTRVDFLPGLPNLAVEDIPQEVLFVGEKETVFSRTLTSLGKVLPQAKALVMNFFEELDPPSLVQDMRSKVQSLLYIVPVRFPISSVEDASGCLSWLATKKPNSVIYVSFGTVVTPPPHEIVAMAEALEESGFPFLWSLKDNMRSVLPSGFVERTNMCGRVLPWVPQTQVLAHHSLGVFVTHCGSNSVTEAVCSGVPMICRPFFGDQGVVARVIQDVWNMGMIIQGRCFTKNALLKSFNMILVQEEGSTIRDNALKVKNIVQDAARPQAPSARHFNTLVELISTS